MSLLVPTDRTTIIVQRSGALGDVVLTTPIVRRLRRENPNARLGVLTGYSDVFHHNPYLLGGFHGTSPSLVRHVQLDGAYETFPNMHIVEAYFLEAFGDTGDPWDRQQELFFHPVPLFDKALRPVAVHAAVAGWRNRSLPRETWVAVVRGLQKAGFAPVMIGSERDTLDGVDALTFYNSNVMMQASLIDNCVAFIGSDSGLLHVAGATQTPIVCAFTCAKPHTRLPWRQGTLGRDCIAIMPDIACVGCLARRPPPVTTEFCERGDNACVGLVNAEEIIESTLALISLTH